MITLRTFYYQELKDNYMATKVYLAGPINGCSDDECSDWRSYIGDRLKGNDFEMVDPMRRDFRGIEGDHTAEIVEGDKFDIRHSDVFVANAWQVSAGTSMEIMYAYRDGLAPIIIIPKGNKVSPWIRYHSHVIVNTLDEAIQEIRKQHNGH